jgi:hypothetical protein
MNKYVRIFKESTAAYSMCHPGIHLERRSKTTKVVVIAINTAEILIKTLPNT